MNKVLNKNIPVKCPFPCIKQLHPWLSVAAVLWEASVYHVISWQSTTTDYSLLLRIKNYSPFTAVGAPGTLGPSNSINSCSNTKGSLKPRFCVDRALILIMTNCLRIQRFSYSRPFCFWSKVICVPGNCFCALIWYLSR